VTVLVTAPQFDASSAEVIAAEIGGEVVAVDPLAADTVASLRGLASAIARNAGDPK
jgi:zinc transport system substrate-binding protein